MEKYSHTQQNVWWNYFSIPKHQRLHRWCLVVDKWFHHTLYDGCSYQSMLGLKLNHISKRGPWRTVLMSHRADNQQSWVRLGSILLFRASTYGTGFRNIFQEVRVHNSSSTLQRHINFDRCVCTYLCGHACVPVCVLEDVRVCLRLCLSVCNIDY